MLTVYIVDTSAESRNRLCEGFTDLLSQSPPQFDLLPRISFKPVSPSELKHHPTPDIAFIGPELVTDQGNPIRMIRATLSNVPLIAIVSETEEQLVTTERLARLGVDDTITPLVSHSDLLKRIILRSRKVARSRSSRLILIDSGKGGLGATTIAAGLAEAIIDQASSCLLVDLDFTTQSISRFLQSKPFVNHNLKQLLDGTRPITQEFIEQSFNRVWQDAELFCMPPVPENDAIYTHGSGYAHNLHSVLEVVDSIFEFIIIDMANLKGPLRSFLYRLADRVVLVTNSDPAAFFPSLERIHHIRQHLSCDSRLLVIENSLPVELGLDSKVLRDEFTNTCSLEPELWCTSRIPFCRQALHWPASGGTIYSVGRTGLKRSILSCIEELHLGIDIPRVENTHTRIASLLSRLRKIRFLQHRSIGKYPSEITACQQNQIAIDASSSNPDVTHPGNLESQQPDVTPSETIGNKHVSDVVFNNC